MARTKEEISKVLIDTKAHYKTDFGTDYEGERVKVALESELDRRVKKFVDRRLCHMPDCDLVSLHKAIEEDIKNPVFVQTNVKKPAVRKLA